MKLMVVDDEPIILNGIIRMIERAQTPFIEIVGSADGIDAMQKLATFQPDLILTDIHMPEMDGLTLIKEIQALNLCNRFVILTGYDDFAYARQALRYHVLDYLLKPINKDELINVLGKIAKTIQEEQQRIVAHDVQLLKEHILFNTQLDDLPLKPEQLHTLFPAPYTMLMVVQANEHVPLVTAESLTVMGTQQMNIPHKMYVFHSRFLRQTILLANYEAIPTDEELQLACDAMLDINGKQANDYSIGVSLQKKDIERMHDLYVEAIAAMLFNRYFSSNLLTFYQPASEHDHHHFDHLVQYIEQSIDNQLNSEQIEKDVLSILPHFPGNTEGNSKLREQFLICIGVYLQRVGLTPEAIWGAHTATNLFVSNSILHTDSQISEIIAQLIQYTRTTHHHQPNLHTIDKIVAFVEQNYKLDLSLDAVAAHVQMHPNYISMLFRKQMGLTFLHYLHTFRLTKAKQIMQENPEWPINTIAEQVGYENPRHFFKVFKKFENITPGQFRLESSSF